MLRKAKEKDVTPATGAKGRRTKSSNPAPKKIADLLRGHVEARMVRCGKQGCKCTRGELHGPYFYHRTRAYNQRSKSYVRLADVGDVRQACENYRRLQAQLREGRAAFKLLMVRARELFG